MPGINPFLNSVGGIAPFGLRYGGDVPLGENPLPKGLGFFGPLMGRHGLSTELSANNMPLLVPTLNVNELKLLLSGGQPTQDIYKKAEAYADMRRRQGKSPFAGVGDLRIPALMEQRPILSTE